MVNKTLHIVTVLMIFILLTSSVYALTANMGNARMVLKVKPGDTVDKSILVTNINNVTIDISSFASGDLENNTKIINPKFSLLPGEKKNINFQIKVTKEGTTNTKINVKFTTATEKNGVGLASNIIIISSNANNSTNIDYQNEDWGKINPYSYIIVAIAIVFLILIFTVLFYLKKGSKREGKHINRNKKE